ncbi:hypothetical protein J4Q44_G00279210 [Coregonus suidteri]|uniref:Uncharacterized protein n=1 Tax=Coregonus suidteri TaxID=861788 RepID=A0AAN8L1N4_9TELE
MRPFVSPTAPFCPPLLYSSPPLCRCCHVVTPSVMFCLSPPNTLSRDLHTHMHSKNTHMRTQTQMHTCTHTHTHTHTNTHPHRVDKSCDYYLGLQNHREIDCSLDVLVCVRRVR